MKIKLEKGIVMKSTILIMVIVTIVILAVSTVLILDLHRASENEVAGRFRAHQTMIVRQLAREIEQYLRARSRGAQVLSTFASLQHRDMKKMAADIQEYFQYVKKDYVKSISVYDEKGTIIYSTTQDAIGRSDANSDFFQWATRKENKGKQLVSSLIRVEENQVEPPPYFRFLIATPIYQEARDSRSPKPPDKFVGVLTYTVDLEEVIAAFLPLVSTNVTKEHVWILDTSGTVLFQSEHPEMVLRNIRGRDESCMQCHVSFDDVEKILAEKQGTIEYALRERPKKSAAFAPLTFENAAWIIVVNVSLEEASGFLQRQLARTFLLIGLITVALVGASTLIYRSNRLKIRAQEEAKQWKAKRELEDRIRVSEERYRRLVEISPDPIAVHCEGKIVFVNPAAVRLLGATSPDELLGKPALEFVHPDDREMVKRRIAKMLEDGQSAPMVEERFFRMDGSVIDVEVAAAPTTHEGKPAVQVVFRDITERKRAEVMLVDSEKRYRTMFESNPLAMYVYDIETLSFLAVNDAAVNQYGFSREEFHSMSVKDIRPPEEVPVLLEQLSTWPFGLERSGVWKHWRKNGTPIYVEITSYPTIFSGRNARLVLANDITERKRAQEAIRRKDEHHRLVIENIFRFVPEGLLVFSRTLGLMRQNNAFEEIVQKYAVPLGCTEQELTEKIIEQARSKIESGDSNQPEADEPLAQEIHIRRKDQLETDLSTRDEVVLQFNAARIFLAEEEEEEEASIVVSLLDITERKRAEEAVKQSQQNYQGLVSTIDGIVWEADARTFQFTFVSQQAERLLGYPIERWVVEPTFWKDHIHPDDREWAVGLCITATKEKRAHDFEYRMVAADGHIVWLRDIVSVVVENDLPVKLRGVMVDITERKRAESLRSRLSQVLESIAGDQALPQVLESLVRAIEEYVPDMKGSVLLLDAAGKRLRHGAAPNLPDDYNTAIDGLLIGPRVGSCGTAAYEKRLVIVEDIQTDPLWEDFRDLAAKHGLRGCWSQPIIDHEGAVLGTLALYYQQPRKPTEAELDLINTAAHIAGIAIMRKRAEEALRNSETTYRGIINSVSEAIYVHDKDGRFIDVNEGAVSMYGYDREFFMGKTPADLSAPGKNDMAMVARAIEKAFNGEPQRLEFWGLHKDGTAFPKEVHLYPGKYFGENVLIAIALDITERKQAEQEREVLYAIGETVNTTASLDELLQSIHQNIKKVMYAENCYIALCDASTETVSFPFFVDQFDPTPAPRAKRRGMTEYVLRTAKPLLLTPELLDELVRNNEVEIIGTPPESWLGVPLFISRRSVRTPSEDPFGQSKPIGVLVVQSYEPGQKYTEREKDVLVAIGNQVAFAIERKRAEEALRQSEEKYRSIFEESKDAVYISTPGGRWVDINPAGVELFGYASKEQLLEVDIARDLYWDPGKRDDFQRLMRQQGYVQDLESELRRRDGRKLTVLETATAVRDNYGSPIAYRGFIRDITEQRVLEEQFRQAQKMESLGTLAGGIAHDFNNILGIILGYSTLLDRLKLELEPEKFSQSIEAITKATRRGVSLVKQLLTFARKTEAIFESVRINDIISEINKLLQETFPKTITIATSLQSDLPMIIADASQIHQVLLNLCVNARDAMPKGGTLSISTSTTEGESVSSRFPRATARQYVQIEVRDTGVGMDEATRQRMFEPFFTTKGPGKGTGLGGALVFSIVEHHDGFIDVQSKLGEGTTLTVYLPIPEPAVGGLEISQPGRKAVEDEPGGTETILLIEDEEMLMELLKGVLVSKGYTVLTAEDGVQGVKVFRSHQKEIALVLSDMGLPRLSGQEVFRKIREINPQAKVILASGFIDPEIKSELFKAGAKHFILKPYSPNEVLQKIREVIDTNQWLL